jgi:RNA polymerase sigma-70 factor (ECF subfamily)
MSPSESPAAAGPPTDELEPLWQAAVAAWPAIPLPRERFIEHVLGHGEAGALPGVEHAGDVLLACACAAGLQRAFEALEPLLVTAVARATARIDASAGFRDLVAQDLRTRLLVGDRPKIAEYAGRAPLASWLKTAAVRAALNLRRARGDRAHDSIPEGLMVAVAPEKDLVRGKYRGAFEDAVRMALAELPERERALLGASVGEGLGVDALGARFGVGRSTAARWLIAARELLARETRRVLLERLGLTPSELDSVAGELRSQIDVSVVRLLAVR